MATIYERSPRSAPYLITVGGAALNEWLGGWSANAAIVDNHSSQHVLLPDVNVYCPPRTTGNVVTLPALGRVRAQFAVPPGLNDGPPVAGQVALLTFYAEPLMANPGVPDGQVAVTIPRQKLYPDGVTPNSATQPSFTVAAGVTTPILRFTLPPGTVQVRVLATAAGLLFSYQLLVLGHQTGEQYWGAASAPGTPATVPTPTLPFTIPVENDWDTQLDMVVVGDPSFTTQYYISALFAPETPGQAGAAQAVTLPTPAPWQAPNQTPKVGSVTTVAGVYSNIIPRVGAAAHLRLFWARYDLDAVSGGVFAVSIDGVTANVFVINDNGRGPYVLGPFEGAEDYGLNAGQYVFTTNAVTVRFHVSHSISTS